jgi:hypothetical protein
MKPVLQAIVLAAALLLHPAVAGAADTITVYKDPG